MTRGERDCAPTTEFADAATALLLLTRLASQRDQSPVAGGNLDTTANGPVDSPPIAGQIIAQRYELLDPLGRGGFGQVWRALDLTSGSEVAVKLLDRFRITHPVRIRREIAVLRRLRVPGVVRLLDEGVEGCWTFITMEVVAGTGFPGPGATSVDEILARTARMLEVLARVHAQGVVHRDLKPANVLVDERGGVTLLDFGISLGAGDERISSGYDVPGTPAYAAPEQASGEAIGPRADLFTTGVMLFEALTGKLPFEADSAPAMYFARLFGRPRSLRSLRPELPEWLDETISQLLARNSQQRPRSALDVIARLRAGGAIAPEASLPWLGRAAELATAQEAVGAGRSVVIKGERGCGCTRYLATLEERLRESGHPVLRLSAARGSFAPLRDLLEGEVPHAAGLAAIREHHVDVARRRLAGGEVLLVDDLDRLDTATLGVLQACASHGSIVAVLRGRGTLPDALEVTLGPLAEEDLRGLFQGPERIFHLATDSAALLAARTDGVPAVVVGELDAWCAAGFAARDGSCFALDRDVLARIAVSGVAVGARGFAGARGRNSEPPGEFTPRVELPPTLEVVLDALLIATSPVPSPLLIAALDFPSWEIEAALEELLERELVRRVNAGFVAASAVGRWEPPSRERARHLASLHGRLVATFPSGDERRLHHFLGAHGDVLPVAVMSEFVGELLPVASKVASSGTTERARAVLEEGMANIRRGCELAEDAAATAALSPQIRQILDAWVVLALDELVPRAMDRVLHELARVSAETMWGPETHEAAQQLELLVRAALTVPHSPARALALASAQAPFDRADLELARHGVRFRAARAIDPQAEAAVINSAAEWCLGEGGESARVALLRWRSMQHYRLGRFVEAARSSEQAASLARDPRSHLAAMTDAAASWLEAFCLEDAARLALVIKTAAADTRHAYFEAMAIWIERTTNYRREHDPRPDPTLVDDAALLAVPHLEALMALTEATLALRAGELTLCRALARRVASVWRRAERLDFADLGVALEVHAGGEPDAREVEALLSRAIACNVAGIGLQVIALLRARWPDGWIPPPADVDRLARQVPTEHWTRRIDVLSVAESRTLIGSDASTSR